MKTGLANSKYTWEHMSICILIIHKFFRNDSVLIATDCLFRSPDPWSNCSLNVLRQNPVCHSVCWIISTVYMEPVIHLVCSFFFSKKNVCDKVRYSINMLKHWNTVVLPVHKNVQFVIFLSFRILSSFNIDASKDVCNSSIGMNEACFGATHCFTKNLRKLLDFSIWIMNMDEPA